jgi:hypothetical protein
VKRITWWTIQERRLSLVAVVVTVLAVLASAWREQYVAATLFAFAAGFQYANL